MLKLLLLMIPTLMCSEIAEQSGVVIDLEIVGHGIPLLKLDDGKYCFCPKGYNCSVLPRCQRDFKMVAELDYGTRRVEAMNPMILNANGEAENTGDRRFTIHFPTMPKSIHVSVSSWGAITLDGGIVPLDNFTNTQAMDFHIPLEDMFIPRIREVAVYDNLYNGIWNNGTHDQSFLNVQYSIECLGTFPDRFCHLKCVKSKTDSNFARCISFETAEFWTCRLSDNGEHTQCGTSPRSENFDELLIFFIAFKWKLAAVSIIFIIGLLVGCLVRNRPAKKIIQVENEMLLRSSARIRLFNDVI